ncbi:MAG: bifunctional methionine sulfoxide reductase B/A protein [Gammaproteobacteria bacterium]|nr:bifunctional methionine sulfoxide reductase B/A protein [Gammaproteobacteria bacterium]
MTFLDKTNSLTPDAHRVICEQATERPHSGTYNDVLCDGTYLCRRCGLALFRANSQFDAGCGWPSFDVMIAGAVKEKPDADGIRIEIICARCTAHLGHVFRGEYHTANNQRYCVNALALDFILDDTVMDTEEVIVAGGCFWGVEHYLKQLPGVLKTEVGYIGGNTDMPTYDQICQGNTGHYEAVRVLFDNSKIDAGVVLKDFFEIHDPTQTNGQGSDRGHQYQSAIFYHDAAQAKTAHALIIELLRLGYKVVTKVLEANIFWPAEMYHQDYYAKQSKMPYCHQKVSRFKPK